MREKTALLFFCALILSEILSASALASPLESAEKSEQRLLEIAPTSLKGIEPGAEHVPNDSQPIQPIQTTTTDDKTVPPCDPIDKNHSAISDQATANLPVKYWGNSFSLKFHRPSCKFARAMNAQHVIFFNFRREAVAAGQVPCRYCLPPIWTTTSIKILPQTKMQSSPQEPP